MVRDQKDAGMTQDGKWSILSLGPHDSAFVLISQMDERDGTDDLHSLSVERMMR